VLTGTARRAEHGLTEVALDGGGTVLSTEPGEGRVAVSVYPWEIALAPAGSERSGSAQNHLAVEVVSVTAVGNRVRAGLAAPQPLTAELSDASSGELELAPGAQVVATWKAAATRLLRL
jgi:molybdate transport system ATP-binding protein